MVFGAQKNHLIEMVLLSTHSIYIWLKNKKIMFVASSLLKVASSRGSDEIPGFIQTSL